MTTRADRKNSRRAGQTIIFLALILVIITFIALWYFDLHKILHIKYITQNAGDSAALMAGRWQGITLNLIGELNIMHALALSVSNTTAITEITNIQARLCYVGPMVAFMASQHAAKNNGAYVNNDFTSLVSTHAQTVRNDYPTRVGPNGELLFPEPYPNCWPEYADMLDAIAANGVAAGPDNAQFYGDVQQQHILLTPGFYDAIAGQTWCWFYHNAPTLLSSYTNFSPGFCWWPPLPPITYAQPMNSEFYGLHLTKVDASLNDTTGMSYGSFSNTLADMGFAVPGTNAMDRAATWYCYNDGRWGAWDAMSTQGNDPFPAAGPVKPQYDYAGADAVVRVESEAERATPSPGGGATTNTIKWNAAAKPLGYLNRIDLPTAYSIVLPAFRDVRLIPLDASSLPGAGSFNIAWRIHISRHLPGYTDANGNFIEGYVPGGPNAPAVSSGCWYCRQLRTWENPGFRATGVAWLQQYSSRCISTGGGGGGGGGGGRRRGH